MSGWITRLAASRGFQRWASGFPLTRRIARAEGAALFDLVAGFVHSQVLAALVELRILHILMDDGPLTLERLAMRTGVPQDRLRVLLRAGVSLGILRLRGGRHALARRGAALLGVPGLEAMILHHRAFYRDLEDPARFFREGGETELARFWPYVFGAESAEDPEIVRRYSTLMADSQTLVAEETLRAVSFAGTRHLMDVGGGTGSFLSAALAANPGLRATLFDLPEVVAGAGPRLAAAGVAGRVAIATGSFRDDALPEGADAISLVRVLYDHDDETVAGLLARVHAALPSGGQVVVSEPMAGAPRPERAADAYFAIYTLAMGTGRTRTPDEIAALLEAAGFRRVCRIGTHRPFVTSVVTGLKPGGIDSERV